MERGQQLDRRMIAHIATTTLFWGVLALAIAAIVATIRSA